VLKPHKDRPSCEISTTVCFGWHIEGDPNSTSWPIYMEGEKIIMSPGDVVIYRGCDLEHWRDEFKAPEGSWHVQGFFHYVDANGPYADYKLDKRSRIGFKKPMATNNLPAPTDLLKSAVKNYITYLD